MDTEQEIQRAEEARFLLEQPLLKQALDEIEAATIQRWEMAESKDQREDYWRLFKITKLFRRALQSYIETGKLAKLQIEQEKRGISAIWRR